jgi:hypothetical protein
VCKCDDSEFPSYVHDGGTILQLLSVVGVDGSDAYRVMLMGVGKMVVRSTQGKYLACKIAAVRQQQEIVAAKTSTDRLFGRVVRMRSFHTTPVLVDVRPAHPKSHRNISYTQGPLGGFSGDPRCQEGTVMG